VKQFYLLICSIALRTILHSPFKYFKAKVGGDYQTTDVIPVHSTSIPPISNKHTGWNVNGRGNSQFLHR